MLQLISANPELHQFYLAGGTALALQIGHRISCDLDFFSNQNMSNDEIISTIEDYGKVEIVSQSKRILVLLLNNIKVDFVRHPYSLLEPVRLIDKLRLAGLKEIGAMKLHAIAGRGRKRDFIDLFFLLKVYSLRELLSAYRAKFFDGNELMVLRSLNYFDDAEADPDILYINESIDWIEIKEGIKNHLKTEM